MHLLTHERTSKNHFSSFQKGFLFCLQASAQKQIDRMLFCCFWQRVLFVVVQDLIEVHQNIVLTELDH